MFEDPDPAGPAVCAAGAGALPGGPLKVRPFLPGRRQGQGEGDRNCVCDSVCVCVSMITFLTPTCDRYTQCRTRSLNPSQPSIIIDHC